MSPNQRRFSDAYCPWEEGFIGRLLFTYSDAQRIDNPGCRRAASSGVPGHPVNCRNWPSAAHRIARPSRLTELSHALAEILIGEASGRYLVLPESGTDPSPCAPGQFANPSGTDSSPKPKSKDKTKKGPSNRPSGSWFGEKMLRSSSVASRRASGPFASTDSTNSDVRAGGHLVVITDKHSRAGRGVAFRLSETQRDVRKAAQFGQPFSHQDSLLVIRRRIYDQVKYDHAASRTYIIGVYIDVVNSGRNRTNSNDPRIVRTG